MMASGRTADAGRGALGEQQPLRGGFGAGPGIFSSSADIRHAGRGAQLGQSLGRGTGATIPYAGVGSRAGLGAGTGIVGGSGMRAGAGGSLGLGTGSGENSAATRGGNAGRSTGGARAYGPMMGMRGKDSEKKRVKSVTTQVERDPNKRDLLGEPPAVVPGVIGDWVREVNVEK